MITRHIAIQYKEIVDALYFLITVNPHSPGLWTACVLLISVWDEVPE